MKKVITVLALFLSLLGAVSFADQADAATFKRVAYRGGKKLNIWNRSGAGKKIVGQVKSGQKLTLKATATYKGNLWYELKNNTWIMAANTVTTSKYASILKAAKQNKVVSLANKQVGKAYVWGATGPYSFDCSGLTQYVYKKTIGTYLPHYSVTQRYYGKTVSTKKLQRVTCSSSAASQRRTTWASTLAAASSSTPPAPRLASSSHTSAPASPASSIHPALGV